MKVYIVITVIEGYPDTYGDIAGVYKKEKSAKRVVKGIQKIKAKDELDVEGELGKQYGINPEFDMITYLEHTLED